MRKRLAFVLVALLAPAAAQTDEETRRLNLVRDHQESGDMYRFLSLFPDSRHAPEVRRRLMAKRLQPVARLTAGGEACHAVIQQRAAQLLGGLDKRPAYQGIDLRANGELIASKGSQEFLPPGQTDFASRPEAALALDLVARRNGSCTLMQRLSSGSGLPASCRCEPLDASYRFESALANSVLAEYARYRGAHEACADTASAERLALIEGFLDDWIAGYTRWLQAIRSREQRGAVVYPSEQGQAEEVEFALPQVSQRTLDAAAFERAKQATPQGPPEQRAAFCAEGLSQNVQQARLRILLSTRLVKE